MEKVQISINPLECGNEFSLLEIELITSKTHQIRAQLAELGYPILGDYKYGDRNINEKSAGNMEARQCFCIHLNLKYLI